MPDDYIYVPWPANEVPRGIVFVTPGRNAGQAVEVSYSLGIPPGRSVNYDADDGDRWRRTIDHSDGTTTFDRHQPRDFTGWVVTQKVTSHTPLENLSAHPLTVIACDENTVTVRPVEKNREPWTVRRTNLVTWKAPETDDTTTT